MPTPDALDREHTLATAAARLDQLRARDALSPASPGADAGTGDAAPGEAGRARAEPPGALTREEALELLALGEVVARKAGYGRQLTVRTARRVGASWSQIGAALGVSKQSAWEAHTRWIEDQVAEHGRLDYTGMDDAEAATARRLAGHPEETR